MVENKGFLLPVSVLVGALIILGGLIWAVNAFNFKVAVVDLAKISKESTVSKAIEKEITAKGQELKKKFELAKTDAEKSQIQQEFDKFKSEKETEFVNKVKQVVTTVSKRKGIKAVASPQVFIYSDTDITSDVIKELK